MTTKLDTPIGQLVAEEPRAARVFEKYGIDYCCGGKLSLSAVCERKNLDPGAILAELEQAETATAQSEANWNDASLASLAEHILATHHVFLKEEMPRLAQLATKVARVHGPSRPELVELAKVYEKFFFEMTAHLEKEEQILFPAIFRLIGGEAGFPIQNPIRVMEMEHDAAGADLEKMRALTQGYQLPEDACYSYRSLFGGLQALELDTHQHIHKESNILFPKAIALLEQMSPQLSSF